MIGEGQNGGASGASGLAGKRVVLGVTGGIAAYKAAELVRLFTKAGATVQVVMTAAAARFIAPLTLQTLSGNPVAQDLFDPAFEAQIGHIRLADQADVVVVAPVTADAIARAAAGMADDLLTAVLLATKAPVVLAPAMNVNMWTHPLTQANLARLLASGQVTTVGPDRGELACGWIGAGRLIEPVEIVSAVAARLAAETSASANGGAAETRDLAGLRVVVSAGPTHEPIDDVRFLGNRSSGKMGFAVAAAAAARGADVTLLAGPGTPITPAGVGQRIDFTTAAELGRALVEQARGADVVVMAAAVADFQAARPVKGKMSRRSAPGATVSLELVPTPDLLAELGRAVSAAGAGAARPYLVGFAAELAGGDEQALAARAAAKLREKRCDAIVANDVSQTGIGFGADDNAVTVLVAPAGAGANGDAAAAPEVTRIARASKDEVAARLWSVLAPRLGAARRDPQATAAASPGSRTATAGNIS